MVKKGLFVLLPLIAAGAPIALFSAPGLWSQVTAFIPTPASNGSQATLTGVELSVPASSAASAALEPPERPPHDVPIHDLADVLRFDLTPDSVVSRWPRVSAGLAHLELQGYRVPLVTGTAEDDLAGALTYYFDPRQRLDRITFHGTTGNPRRLVDLVTSRFGLARKFINDAGVFLYEIPGQRGRARSFLWIRPAPVVKASDPHHRFEVAMVIQRPKEG
jgi:hypothetical protein